MARFTKKSVTIDAVLVDDVLQAADDGGFSSDPLRVPQWIVDAFTSATIGFELHAVLVNTHHGQARAERGDWVIRGVDGELYPCKADVFAKTYEPAIPGEVPIVASPPTASQLWEVYRCSEAAPNEACGIRTCENGISTLIVSDTNREECCHHMQRADAEHIVRLHNDHVLGAPVLVLKGDISPEQFREFKEKWNREVQSLASRAPILDADRFGANAPEPPPQRRDDLKPAWEIVFEEFRDRYSVGDYLVDTSAVAAVRDVLDDMTARDLIGRAKYGVPLTAHNGRDQLVDAYQELLDAAVYLRAAMEEGISGASAVYSNTLHNIFWLRVAINSRAARNA